MVFTGLVIGAVAIGAYAYVSQSGDDRSAADELGLAHGGNSAHSARGDIMSGAITSGSVKTSGKPAASEAERLHAARKSLLRDDVAAARARPNAPRPGQQNDDQGVALKQQAQTDQAQQRALAASPVDTAAQPEGTAARIALYSAMQSAPSRDSQFAAHEHPKRASPSYAKNRRAVQTVTAAAGSYSASNANVSTATALHDTSQRAYASPAMNVVESAPGSLNVPIAPIAPMAPQASASLQQPEFGVAAAQSKPQAEITAQAILSPPLVQTMPADAVSPKLDSGPKTRAQVRAEIVRARADGSLPAFGNPDPAGPGGAPSLAGAARRD
jgi:hypothetical protein